MTLLDSPARTSVLPAVQSAPDPRPSKDARAAALLRTRRVAAVALAVVVVLGAVFVLFDGPIANAWNALRQHQLASQWSAQRPHVGRGNAIALLQVPSLHLSIPIAEGDAPQQLRSGPGHRMDTPAPGAVGNSVVVGHHVAWGGPFAHLADLKRGSLIAVQTQASGGPIGVFEVQSVRTVAGNDLAPFANSTDHRITIVTGSGGRFSDRRLVVTAVSGKIGKTLALAPVDRASTPSGSPILNSGMALAAVAVGIAGLLAWWMRRRYRMATIVIVVAPFFVLTLLALLLNIDAALPPLR